MSRPLRSMFPLAALLFATASTNPSDVLDSFVVSQMARRQIPGLSLAIIQDGRVVEARAYGVTDRGGARRVETTTLFQAGSISKSVAAYGALHLVEQHTLDLDADVNATLKTWKLPASGFTSTKSVTLRGLLSHTAGLTVHGFPGYATGAKLPSLVQVLDGSGPANTAPIRSETVPGAKWNYSGGGYTIMQQMILDVTGQSFPEFMRHTVLAPLGMMHSSYEQPLAPAMAAATAAGHYQNGKVVNGRWHIYPEMAAAGLWTTPSDLARFAIDIQQSVAGASTKVISAAMAKQMLTDQKDMDGLGVFLQGNGPALRFSHNGRDEGFDAELTATATSGQGVVIMINANDDSRMVSRLRTFIASRYHWPDAVTYTAPTAVRAPASQLEAVSGNYEFMGNQILTLVAQDGSLFTVAGGHADEEFLPVGNDRFTSAERPATFVPVRDAAGDVVALTWGVLPTTRTIPRIGPIVRSLVPQRDTDPGVTARVDTVLRALGQGGGALKRVRAVSEGARTDFGDAPWQPAVGLRRLTFVSAQDIVVRNIERHGSKVARAVYYRMTTSGGERLLLEYLTSDGLVTDVDVLDV